MSSSTRTARRYSRESDSQTYLGYRIVIAENKLTILDPQGRGLVTARLAVSTARRQIRQWRREDLRAAASVPEPQKGSGKEPIGVWAGRPQNHPVAA